MRVLILCVLLVCISASHQSMDWDPAGGHWVSNTVGPDTSQSYYSESLRQAFFDVPLYHVHGRGLIGAAPVTVPPRCRRGGIPYPRWPAGTIGQLWTHWPDNTADECISHVCSGLDCEWLDQTSNGSLITRATASPVHNACEWMSDSGATRYGTTYRPKQCDEHVDEITRVGRVEEIDNILWDMLN